MTASPGSKSCATARDILDCLTRFSRAMDRFDRALFLSAFHDDAVIAAGNYVGGPVGLFDWAVRPKPGPDQLDRWWPVY